MKGPRRDWQGRWLLAAAILSLGAPVSRASEVIEVKPGQAQLFLDDLVIEKVEGLTRAMHPPAKRGAVIRSPQPEKTLQTRSAPAWEPTTRRYSLWVLGTEDTLWHSADGLTHEVADASGMSGHHSR